jgi:hypothetical protein
MPGMLDVSLFNDVGAVITQHYATPSDGMINRWKFYEPASELEPEQKLIKALLGQAVRDLRGGYGDYLMRDARRWITERDGGGYSFDYCCEAMGVDRAYLRKRLLAK